MMGDIQKNTEWNMEDISKQQKKDHFGSWFMGQTGLKVTTAIQEKMDRAIHLLAHKEKISKKEYIQSLISNQISGQRFVDLVTPMEVSFLGKENSWRWLSCILSPLSWQLKTGTRFVF